MNGSAVPWLLLDLGGIKKRGNDRGRPDADGDPGLYKLLPPFFACLVVVIVAHAVLFMASRRALEAA